MTLLDSKISAKNTLKAVLILISNVIVGIIGLVIIQSIEIDSTIASASLLVLYFLLINVFYMRVFKLREILKDYWSIKWLYMILIGIVLGIGINVVSSFFSSEPSNSLNLNDTIKPLSLIITLLIVGWEELWFRGIFLNHCAKLISPISISVITGILFTGIHLLNPEFDIFNNGLDLFLAGYLLTIIYYYFKNIWMPIGLHFGNNVFPMIFNAESIEYQQSLTYQFILASLGLLFSIMYIVKKRQTLSNSEF